MLEPKEHRMFIALNGPVLHDYKAALAGLAIVEHDSKDDSLRVVNVQFYEGAAGAHATSINPMGTIGYLGNFAHTPIVYDTKNGDELLLGGKRSRTFRIRRAMGAAYHGPTHAVWVSGSEYICAVDDQFVKFDLYRPDWKEVLGPHRVPWPHAMKLSASGRYIFYGSLDHPDGRPARVMGVFDLQYPNPQWRAAPIHVPITVWHVTVHPTKDIGYAVTQRYRNPRPGDEFAVAIELGINFAFKVDLTRAHGDNENCIIAMNAYGTHYPNHLSADIAVLDDDRIIANFCASGQNGVINFKTGGSLYLDERLVGNWRKKFGYDRWFGGNKKTKLELLRSFGQNLADAGCIVDLPSNTDLLWQAIRAINGSKADGPFGLSVNKQQTRFFSIHRGLNAVLMYDMTKPWPWPLMKKQDLPKSRGHLPKHLGISKHLGLGTHHVTAI